MDKDTLYTTAAPEPSTTLLIITTIWNLTTLYTITAQNSSTTLLIITTI